MSREFKGTPGEWSVPHLASDSTTCNCGFVLSEQYCGAIATVNWSPDRELKNGDNPPLEEAIANAKLIAAAPKMLKALKKARLDLKLLGLNDDSPMIQNIDEVLSKVLD